MQDIQKKKQLLSELLTQAEKVRKENVFKSSALGNPAYVLAEELQDRNSMAKAMYYIYIGSCYGKKQNNMHLLHEALQWIDSNEVAFVVRFYNLLALENTKRGCYALAADYFSLGLELAQKADHVGLLYTILNNTGELFYHLEEYDRAIAYFHESYECGQQLEENHVRDRGIYALNNLVVTYSEKEEFGRAKHYLDEVERVYDTTVCHYSRTRYDFAKGCYLKGMKSYDKAIESFNTFLDQVNVFDTPLPRVETFKQLGECYEHLGKDKAALECYKQVVEQSMSLVGGCDELYSLKRLAALYRKQHNFEKALHYHEAFTDKIQERNRYTNDICSKYILQRMQFTQLKEAKSFVEEEHKRAIEDHKHMTRAYKRLDLAVTIGNALNSNPTVTSLLSLLHDQIMNLMPMASISIGRYSEAKKKIKLAYIIDAEGVKDDIVLDVNQSDPFYMKTCIEERASLMIRKNEEFTYKPLKDYPLQAAYKEIQSALYVPVIANDRVKGVISVQSKEPFAYNSEDLKVLEVIAAYFAQINFEY